MVRPSHPQAIKARHEAEMARKTQPHSGFTLHLARELENAAEEIDRQYHAANFFLPKLRLRSLWNEA